MGTSNVIAFVTSAAGSGLLLILLVPVLTRMRVLDVPNVRSSHSRVTPRGGGVAVLFGVLAGVSAAHIIPPGSAVGAITWVACSVGTVLGGLGLIDDLKGLGAGARLMGQCAVGLASSFMVTLVVGVDGVSAVALSLVGAFWIISFVNAYNFMDGINGISAWIAIVSGGWYAAFAATEGDAPLMILGLALAGGAAGFLPWNAVMGKIFLGDVGSYGIGAILAALALWVAVEHHDLPAAIAPLSVYLADTAFTLVRRLRLGEKLSTAHRDHIYQRLTRGGWRHQSVALLVAGLSTAVCALVYWLPVLWAVIGSLTVVALYLVLPTISKTRREYG